MLNYDSDTGVPPRQQNLVGGNFGNFSDNSTKDSYKNIQAPLTVAIRNQPPLQYVNKFEANENKNYYNRPLSNLEAPGLSADQAMKLRTLEMNLIDFKGQIDR